MCYSEDTQQFMVVMTERNAGQAIDWFDSGELFLFIFLNFDWKPSPYLCTCGISSVPTERREEGKFLDEKQEEGYHPTIVFKVPRSLFSYTKDLLLVVTMDDKREKAYVLSGSSWGNVWITSLELKSQFIT